jgi:pimeloyl-ACP methyl ester carboxylesterase
MRTRIQPPTDTPVTERRRRRRWPIVALALVVVLAAVFYLGGGWYFSGRLYQQALSGAAKRAARPTYHLTVVAVTPATVTLGVPTDPGQLLTPGVWGLQWPTGYGQVTRIVGRDQATVTRAFRHLTGSALAPGARVALDNKAFPQNPRVGLGLPFQDVTYRGPLGPYPAWLVPGARDTWAILVHGNAMDRLDTIKVVPALHRLGLPVLMISYRNDAEAPPDPSGMLRYGLTEWQDLAAAAQYALGHGARRLLLVGYSMGGAIVISFLERSPLAARVAGVMLDSPMTDLGRAVDHGASRQRLPLVGLPLPQSLTDVSRQLERANLVYGAFAIVGVLLSWLYLSAQVLLYAAEVNVVLARRLWPRSLLQSPLTGPDQQVLAALAQIEERLPRGDHRGQVLP